MLVLMAPDFFQISQTWRSLPSIAGQLAGDFTQTKGSPALGILYEMVSG
jgi:hypothetical protein